VPGAVKVPVIAGNWKMYKGPDAARSFCAEFVRAAPPPLDRTVLLFPPAISVSAARDALGGHDVGVGVQNIHWETRGRVHR
jgi:triosephosphate isomerase (TIM)